MAGSGPELGDLRSMGLLALVTVVALVIAWLVRPEGVAVIGGLALFQFLAIVSSMLPLIKEIRQK